MKIKSEKTVRGGWPAREIEATLVFELTDCQLEGLLTAVDLGYFEYPREANGDDLSRVLKVSYTPAIRRVRYAVGELATSFDEAVEAEELKFRDRVLDV